MGLCCIEGRFSGKYIFWFGLFYCKSHPKIWDGLQLSGCVIEIKVYSALSQTSLISMSPLGVLNVPLWYHFPFLNSAVKAI